MQKIDARLSKVFPITERSKAMFTFDAFNVFNHRFFTSISTRAYTASIVNGQGILSPATGYGVGSASQGFPDGTNARRLQLGLRFAW